MTVAEVGTIGPIEGLDDVRVFAAVVEAGSFTAAGRALRLPKSTVSRRVERLERRLGVRLLERTTRRQRLTEAGAAFHARAVRGLAALDEAAAVVREQWTGVRGTLRVTAPVEFGNTFLGPVVADFLVRHPEVSVEVTLTNRTVDLVGEGYDLAIRAGALADSSLTARRLAVARRHVCAAPDYLRRRGVPRAPAELAHHDCIVHGGAPVPGRWHLQGPEGPVEVAVRGRLTADSFAMLRQAALAGLGVVMLPAFVVAGDLASGRLVPVLEAWGEAEGSLWAVHPGGRHLPGKLRAFLDHLVGAFEPGRALAP